MEKLNKKQAEEKLNLFFLHVKNKSQEEIRKMKRLSMHHKIKLGKRRKLFCQKCYFPKLKVLSIKNRIKRIKCENCARIFRWKI